MHDSDKFERVQLCTPRIVNWLPIFVSSEILNSETGWKTLHTIRCIVRITTIFKINMEIVPDYFFILFLAKFHIITQEKNIIVE